MGRQTVTDDAQSTDQSEALEPREHGKTGVLDTGGSGLYHGQQPGSSGAEPTPRDVSQADPFVHANRESAADDGGDGMNTTGKQYEYSGEGEITREF
jgi:hypothetical protein